MKRLFAITLLLSLTLPACQKSKKAPTPPPACGQDSSIGVDKVTRHDTMKLGREYQQTRRTSCDGKTADSKVLVREPKDSYSIFAQTLTRTDKEYSVWAMNRTTCDTATIKKRDARDPRMEIQLHTSKGTRRTHVLKNQDNYIDYEFRECVRRNQSGQCTASQVAERGTVILKIEYFEKDLEGVEDLKDTNCAPVKP